VSTRFYLKLEEGRTYVSISPLARFDLIEISKKREKW
jgi:hypothetical protein